MITPRATRLVRASDLRRYRQALVALACDGAPGSPAPPDGGLADARDRLLVLPTRTAAAHLVRTIERHALDSRRALILPDMCTASELVSRLAARLPGSRRDDDGPAALPPLTDAEREVLLGLACREVRDAGIVPPFRLRPALIAEVLLFYDALRGFRKDVDTFERLALGALEPGAAYDRGAERLVRQTRFLVAAFRVFEERCRAAGGDVHTTRARLLATPVERPVRHVVLAVGDYAFDRQGIVAADWDLLSRLPGLERLDIVVTDRALAGAPHERLHQLLPGIEEVRFDARERAPADGTGPVLLVAPDDAVAHVARDREEEVAGFARRIKAAARRGGIALSRTALVVRQPLPYVYVAREVLRSAGIPSQTFDALPLAAEPYAAALDLVLAAAGAGFARGPAIALLRSPHFVFHGPAATPIAPGDVSALDRALSEAGYLGELEALDRHIEQWQAARPGRGAFARALGAAGALRIAAAELAPLRRAAPADSHLSVLLAFLAAHEAPPAGDTGQRERQRRARGAVVATLEILQQAYARFDQAPVEFDEVTATIRRWIEGRTFAPRAGTTGVHIVDAGSARFGEFDEVQLAGVVEDEWPEPPRRNIFYPPALLRDLGWPAEAERVDGARSEFADLLRLPSERLAVSGFVLEADALVAPSPLVDDVAAAGLSTQVIAPESTRIFEDEALALEPFDPRALPAAVAAWAGRRHAADRDAGRSRGFVDAVPPAPWSVSALERYQDCPFRFFAGDVLRLQEAPEDGTVLSPRVRGRFIHEVCQRFFEAWDAERGGTITVDRLDEARDTFVRVAGPLLDRLPDADAALERARLFGSAIAVGLVDVVLGIEAARPAAVRERLLEHRLDGTFSLGEPGRRVALKGVADRIDLLDGRRLRVIDYKSGVAPNPKRAIQVAIYALCAQERLSARDGAPWRVDEAAYIAFTGRRPVVSIVKPDRAPDDVLAAARRRLFDLVAGIERGEFPPRPHDPIICGSCAYSSVCRKDYVGDE